MTLGLRNTVRDQSIHCHPQQHYTLLSQQTSVDLEDFVYSTQRYSLLICKDWIMLGAVGAYDWNGTVIMLKDTTFTPGNDSFYKASEGNAPLAAYLGEWNIQISYFSVLHPVLLTKEGLCLSWIASELHAEDSRFNPYISKITSSKYFRKSLPI